MLACQQAMQWALKATARGPRLAQERLGYGTWWLPIVELPLTTPQIIPDLSFYVRF